MEYYATKKNGVAPHRLILNCVEGHVEKLWRMFGEIYNNLIYHFGSLIL